MQKYVNLIAFLQTLILKEHVAVIIIFTDWVQGKKYTMIYSFKFIHSFTKKIGKSSSSLRTPFN